MSALLFIASAGLVLPAPPQRAHAARRAAPTTMLDIPRITLPAAVADPIKDLDLKSPNDLSQAEYNSYSAAAIGGTLIFFILPLFDILGFFGDFVFSALVGGGVGAYASLRKVCPAGALTLPPHRSVRRPILTPDPLRGSTCSPARSSSRLPHFPLPSPTGHGGRVCEQVWRRAADCGRQGSGGGAGPERQAAEARRRHQELERRLRPAPTVGMGMISPSEVPVSMSAVLRMAARAARRSAGP